MKKLLLIAAGIFLGLFGLGSSFSSTQTHPAVQGISTQATLTPSITPSAPLTPTIVPTNTLVPTQVIVTPTKKIVVYTPTNTPTVESSGLSNDKYYTNSAGTEVHSPANSTNGTVPVGATARCGDGTYSFSQSHRGTCSHHGGVAQWL